MDEEEAEILSLRLRKIESELEAEKRRARGSEWFKIEAIRENVWKARRDLEKLREGGREE